MTDMNNPIRRHRTERNMTIEDLATLLGISRSTVIRWESGTSIPTRSVRNRLARRLGIDQAQLERELGLAED